MSIGAKNDKNCVYVQYCRSCETHSWCTHHDQSKYHDTFLKLVQLIGKEFPNLEVVGNMVPETLLPIKINQNKYLDSVNNKYVVFPAIGAFQVIFNGNTVFSKKATNAWPNFYNILSSIGKTIYGNENQIQYVKKQTITPKKSQTFPKSPKKNNFQKDDLTQKDNYNNSYLDNADKRSTFHKQKNNNFTLTDHFKLYKANKYQDSQKESYTQNERSQRQISSNNQSEFPQFRGKKQHASKSNQKNQNQNEKIKDILMNKGGFMFKEGKKEMIVKLDSIQEESIVVEDQRIPNIHHSQSKHKKTNRMKEFDTELSELEDKFKTFEEKVNIIKKKNKQFEHKMPLIDDKNRENADYDGQVPNHKVSKHKYQSRDFIENAEVKGSKSKLGEMDAYIYSSQKEKNEKLHKIYGEWKLTKKQKRQRKLFLKKKKLKLLEGKDGILRDNQNDSDQQNSDTSSSSQEANEQQKKQNQLNEQENRYFQKKKLNLMQTKGSQKNKNTSIQQQKGKSNKSLKMKTQSEFFRGNRFGTIGSKKNVNINDSQRKMRDDAESLNDKIRKKDYINIKNPPKQSSTKNSKHHLNLNRDNRILSNKMIEEQRIHQKKLNDKEKQDINKINNKISHLKMQLQNEFEGKSQGKEKVLARQSQNSSLSNYFFKDQKNSRKPNLNHKPKFNNFNEVDESEQQQAKKQSNSRKVLKKIENKVIPNNKGRVRGSDANYDKQQILNKINQSSPSRQSYQGEVQSKEQTFVSQKSSMKKKPIREIFGKIKKNTPSQRRVPNESDSIDDDVENQVQEKGSRHLTSQQSDFIGMSGDQHSAKNTLKTSLYDDQRKRNDLNVQKQIMNISIDGKKTKKKKHRGKNQEQSVDHKKQEDISEEKDSEQKNEDENNKESSEKEQKESQSQSQVQKKIQHKYRFATDRNTEDDASSEQINNFKKQKISRNHQSKSKNKSKMQKQESKNIDESKAAKVQFHNDKKEKDQQQNNQSLNQKKGQEGLQKTIKSSKKQINMKNSRKNVAISGQQKEILQQKHEPTKNESKNQKLFSKKQQQKHEPTKNESKNQKLSSKKQQQKHEPTKNESKNQKLSSKKQKQIIKKLQTQQQSELIDKPASHLNSKQNLKPENYQADAFQNQQVDRNSSQQQSIKDSQDQNANNAEPSDQKVNKEKNSMNKPSYEKQNTESFKKPADQNVSKSSEKQFKHKDLSDKLKKKNDNQKSNHINSNPRNQKAQQPYSKISNNQLKQEQRKSEKDGFLEVSNESNDQTQVESNQSNKKSKEDIKEQSAKKENSKKSIKKSEKGKSSTKVEKDPTKIELSPQNAENIKEQNDKVSSEKLKIENQIINQSKSIDLESKQEKSVIEKQKPTAKNIKIEQNKTPNKKELNSQNQHQNVVLSVQNDKSERQNVIKQEVAAKKLAKNNLNDLQKHKKQHLIDQKGKTQKKSETSKSNTKQRDEEQKMQKEINDEQFQEQKEEDNEEIGEKQMQKKSETLSKQQGKSDEQQQHQKCKQINEGVLDNNQKSDKEEEIEQKQKEAENEELTEKQKINDSQAQFEGKNEEENKNQSNQMIANRQSLASNKQVSQQKQKQKIQTANAEKIKTKKPQNVKTQKDMKKELKISKNKKNSKQQQTQKANNKPKIKVYDDNDEEYSNNVYSNQKKIAEYHEIGVQKELTVQVSIQTDQFPLISDENALAMQKNTILRDGEVFSAYQTSRPINENLEKSHFSRNQSFTEGQQNLLSSQIQQKINFIENNNSEYMENPTTDSKFKTTQEKGNQIIRAKILNQIYGEAVIEQSKKYDSLIKGLAQQSDKTSKNMKSLAQVYKCKQKPILFSDHSLEIDKIRSNKFLLSNFRKIIQILGEKNQYIFIRLYQNIKNVPITSGNFYGMWLCNNYKWECVIVDDMIEVDEEGIPMYNFHEGKQVWIHILEKALCKILGSYENLAKIECSKLFSILTGSNSLSFSIKEDPTKNARFLKYVSECQNKNFIIHADKICKNIHEIDRKETEVCIYYIHSVKSVNGQETVLEISENRKKPFWIKMSKFVQDFKTAEILQLRINHNFTNICVQKSKSSNLTVVELDFEEECFGSITLALNKGNSTLKAFLYRQEKTHILKLIGQAKQKSKPSLFFDCLFSAGKYYVFAQADGESCRIAYFGQGKPTLSISQQIQTEGLKNDFTEYLPISKLQAKKQNENALVMPKEIHRRVPFNQTGVSFNSNSNSDKISRLRQNFVDYLLRDSENLKLKSRK